MAENENRVSAVQEAGFTRRLWIPRPLKCRYEPARPVRWARHQLRW